MRAGYLAALLWLAPAVALGQAFIDNAGSGSKSVPKWKSRPTAAQTLEAYPSRALQEKTSGKATIRCIRNPLGYLRSCVVQSETPSGQGFGAAALSLADFYQQRVSLSSHAPSLSVMVTVSFVCDGCTPLPADPQGPVK